MLKSVKNKLRANNNSGHFTIENLAQNEDIRIGGGGGLERGSVSPFCI